MWAIVLFELCLTQVDANWQIGLRHELRARDDRPGRPPERAAVPDRLLSSSRWRHVDFGGRTYRLITSYAPRIVLRNIDSR